MDFKEMLRKLIDSLSEDEAKSIYYVVLGVLGRVF